MLVPIVLVGLVVGGCSRDERPGAVDPIVSAEVVTRTVAAGKLETVSRKVTDPAALHRLEVVLAELRDSCGRRTEPVSLLPMLSVTAKTRSGRTLDVAVADKAGVGFGGYVIRLDDRQVAELESIGRLGS